MVNIDFVVGIMGKYSKHSNYKF